jgi:hypothetical protein
MKTSQAFITLIIASDPNISNISQYFEETLPPVSGILRRSLPCHHGMEIPDREWRARRSEKVSVMRKHIKHGGSLDIFDIFWEFEHINVLIISWMSIWD